MKSKIHVSIPSILALLLGGLLLAGAPRAHAQINYVTTVESTPNLLGYWRFSPESQANSEVNGYTGTFLGDAMVGPSGSGPTLVGDPTNTAVLLDGTNNSYVTTDLMGQIDQQGSIVGWFYLTELPSDAGQTFYIAGESDNGDDLDLQIETDNVLRFYTSSGGNVAAPSAFTASDLNQWHFVAATFTANTSRNIYLDGVLVANNVAEGHGVNSAPFTMGASSVFGGRYFTGALDEMALYNRQLTDAEVAAIYASATQQNPPLQLTDAVSRVTQGSAGTFDIELPQDGSGVECRSTGGNYDIVFTFTNDVVSASASLMTQNGGTIVGDPVISGNTVAVELSGVTDNQTITVTLSNVTDVYSQVVAETDVSALILIGDVNADGVVNMTDYRTVRSQAGQPVTESNFRDDINADGIFTRNDSSLVRKYRTVQ